MLGNQVSVTIQYSKVFGETVVQEHLLSLFVDEHHRGQGLGPIVARGIGPKEGRLSLNCGVRSLCERFEGGMGEVIGAQCFPFLRGKDARRWHQSGGCEEVFPGGENRLFFVIEFRCSILDP